LLVESRRPLEAQRVFGETTAILDRLSPRDRSQALKLRGHFQAILGERDKAIANLAKAIELGSDDVYGVWCPLAFLYLSACPTDEYRSLCDGMLKRSGHHWVIGICTLTPNAVTDLAQPVRIAPPPLAPHPPHP